MVGGIAVVGGLAEELALRQDAVAVVVGAPEILAIVGPLGRGDAAVAVGIEIAEPLQRPVVVALAALDLVVALVACLLGFGRRDRRHEHARREGEDERDRWGAKKHR